MKYFICLFLVVSCTSPVTNVTNTSGRHVMNSLWKDVTSSASRSAVNLDQNVDAYNATHIDDQWFIVDGEIPDLDNAPPGCIFLVDKENHDPIQLPDGNGGFITLTFPDVSRRWIVEHYTGYLQDAVAANADLYVDVVPPAPTPPTEEQLYAKYSFYAIDSTGAIMYQDHGYPLIDGWPSLANWESTQQSRYQLIVANPENANVPWTVISGQVYTAP